MQIGGSIYGQAGATAGSSNGASAPSGEEDVIDADFVESK